MAEGIRGRVFFNKNTELVKHESNFLLLEIGLRN
jgi:hypothetical protein